MKKIFKIRYIILLLLSLIVLLMMNYKYNDIEYIYHYIESQNDTINSDSLLKSCGTSLDEQKKILDSIKFNKYGQYPKGE